MLEKRKGSTFYSEQSSPRGRTFYSEQHPPKIYFSRIPDVAGTSDCKTCWCVNMRFAQWLFGHPRILGIWLFLFTKRKLFK